MLKKVKTCNFQRLQTTCPFYEWQLEGCYHIQAHGAEILRVFQYCFGSYKTCVNFSNYARTPEGTTGLNAGEVFKLDFIP